MEWVENQIHAHSHAHTTMKQIITERSGHYSFYTVIFIRIFFHFTVRQTRNSVHIFEWVWILVFPCHGKYRKELRTQLLWQGKCVCCKRKKSNELIYIFFLLSLPSSHFFSVLFAHFSWRFCCFLGSLPNLLWENECCNFGAMPVCNSNNCLH